MRINHLLQLLQLHGEGVVEEDVAKEVVASGNEVVAVARLIALASKAGSGQL